MDRRFTTALLLFATAGIAPAQGPLPPSIAEPASIDRSSAKSAAMAKLVRRLGQKSIRLRWRDNNTVESAAGFVSRSYPGTKAEAARAFLLDHAEMVGGSRLAQQSERSLGNFTYIRFQQQLDGVPIRGAHVVVNVDSGNAVRAINARVEPGIARGGEWRITKEDAIERAVKSHGAQPSDAPTAEREYKLGQGRAWPMWVVAFRSADPAGDWEYVIAADTGRVVERQNLRRGVNAAGFAYPRNPVRGGREQVTLENLGTDGSLTSAQTKVFTYFPALKGQVAPGTVVQGAGMRNGNFLYEADDARAAEVQLYWGMETASARFRALGFNGFQEPMRGVVYFQDWDAENKRFTGSDNAFFLANAFGQGKGGMFFYLTSRQGDTSLDTDVIFHEYAHAVINEFVGPRQTAAFRALNEGTADYFSSSFLDDPIMAEYAAKIFGLRNPFLRRTDNEQAWPYSHVGEEHADGNIWSGALWDMRRILGANVADEIVMNTVAFLSPDAEFYDAAVIAVLTADEIYGGKVAEVVARVMEQRGILTQAAETASDAQWMESGGSADGSISAASPGFLLVGEQQYRIDVPHRATKLIVRLRASGNARFYLRYRVPVTVENGRIQAEQFSDISTEASGYLSLDNTPELQAGTYYVAVVNASTERIDYNVGIEVENYDAAARPALIRINDGATVRGSMPSGPFLGSRQFAVEVPEGAAALSITLEGDQDVDLYVRQARYVTINGTGYPEAELVSNSASSREDLRITGENGARIPPGLYVVGTYNYSPATTKFKVTARVEY